MALNTNGVDICISIERYQELIETKARYEELQNIVGFLEDTLRQTIRESLCKPRGNEDAE